MRKDYKMLLFRTVLCWSIALLLGLAVWSVQAQERGRITNDEAGVFQIFPVNVKAGDTLTIRVNRLSGNLIPAIGIVNPAGSFILRESAADGAAELVVTHEFADGGEHDIYVSREGALNGDSIGDFVLTIEHPGKPTTTPVDDAVYVAIYEARELSGVISEENNQDEYYVYLQAAQILTASIDVESIDSELNTALTLALAERPLERASLPNDILSLSYQAEQRGWFKLVVTRFDDPNSPSSGTYLIHISLSN